MRGRFLLALAVLLALLFGLGTLPAYAVESADAVSGGQASESVTDEQLSSLYTKR